MITLRPLSCLLGSVGLLVGLTGCQPTESTAATPSTTRPTTLPASEAKAMTDADWKKVLTADQFYILRKEGTERPFVNAYHDNHTAGEYVCAADGSLLFRSTEKYDSGTGWPSFWKPVTDAAVTLKTDIDGSRTEVECATCGGHLGHVFNDGPEPTGQRFCMNSGAMIFVAGK